MSSSIDFDFSFGRLRNCVTWAGSGSLKARQAEQTTTLPGRNEVP